MSTDSGTEASLATESGDVAPVLEVCEAVKKFGPVLALQHVNLRLYPNEVLALLGDNGAGKSTLIKAISGVHPLDGGEILLDGQPQRFRNPTAAREAGIETVYQDLALFDNLNISANFYAGREVCLPRWLGSLGLLQDKQMDAETSRIIDELEVNLPDPRAQVGLMSGGQRQAIAVARAVAFGKRIIVLDEPTAALGARESRNVLNLIRRLPGMGFSVILISHNLEQVMSVADRAMVLRRGQNIGERPPTEENHEALVSMIVGGSRADT